MLENEADALEGKMFLNIPMGQMAKRERGTILKNILSLRDAISMVLLVSVFWPQARAV
jgi:hypothetical protein